MMRRSGFLLVLAVAACILPPPGQALAQQRPQAQERKFYDSYEPSQRLRTRREICSRDEEYFGAYCVKKCRANYALLANSKPARCRSVTPLAAGQLPGPVSKETATLPRPPRTPEPPQPGVPKG
jgi:hypothetical protein